MMPTRLRARVGPPFVVAGLLALGLLLGPALVRGATVELLDGTRIECKVLAKDDTQVTIEVTMNDVRVKRMIPLAKVHRVTINDKTYVVNERSPDDKPARAEGANAPMKGAPTKATPKPLSAMAIALARPARPVPITAQSKRPRMGLTPAPSISMSAPSVPPLCGVSRPSFLCRIINLASSLIARCDHASTASRIAFPSFSLWHARDRRAKDRKSVV